MKGILLAGGNGTRLNPCTLVVNKHLIPVYNKPMIYYPIETLVKAGCTDILIVCGEAINSFAKLIGDGHHLGLKSVLYAYQCNADGISGALKLARSFIGKDKFVVMLGDNIVFDDISPFVNDYEKEEENTCKLFIKEIQNPSAFGVAEIHDNRITNIIEKPANPPSNYAVVGVYMYDYHVFDVIDNIKPSKRGELEITDVNLDYVKRNKATYSILNSDWFDTGSFKSLLDASILISSM
jgi:glucose-1-phosphate thymidylyltransferase